MKQHPIHVCKACQATSPKWVGRCPKCGGWNTFEEGTSTSNVSAQVAPQGDLGSKVHAPSTVPLGEVEILSSIIWPSGLAELDRVLGGGFLPGSTTLLYGEPGVGKSTLALMVLLSLASEELPVVVLATEESPMQIAQRASRLGVIPAALRVAATPNVDEAVALIREMRPTLCVVDSLSAMRDDSLDAVVGSVVQVRSAAERLCAVAKETGTALVLVGHVTKDGDLAGPRVLEHLVDTVVSIEGDRHGSLRVLRALKHRFGPTGELGILEMVNDGLRDMSDAALALRGPSLDVEGVVATVTSDGSRNFLVDIQALVTPAAATPRRVAHQMNAQRLAFLLAVLESRCGVSARTVDLFVASAGGLPASEPSVDLALCIALSSALSGVAVPRGVVAIGEVGLAGELRPVTSLSQRVREAQRLGATVALIPNQGDLEDIDGIEILRFDALTQALAWALDETNR